jgi:hypothetical protein
MNDSVVLSNMLLLISKLLKITDWDEQCVLVFYSATKMYNLVTTGSNNNEKSLQTISNICLEMSLQYHIDGVEHIIHKKYSKSQKKIYNFLIQSRFDYVTPMDYCNSNSMSRSQYKHFLTIAMQLISKAENMKLDCREMSKLICTRVNEIHLARS